MATQPPTGFAGAADYGDDYAQLSFMMWQHMKEMATIEIVRVVAVTNTGGVAPVGLLDCQPMVQQVTGAGIAVDHGILNNVPYFRLQGGTNAIIMDPAVGDIGFVLFSARDASKVKNTKAPAPPGSGRRFDWSDGIYVGGILNGVPANYIQFDSAGDVRIKPASKVYITGELDVTGDVLANGISLVNHLHGDVAAGSAETGKPIA